MLADWTTGSIRGEVETGDRGRQAVLSRKQTDRPFLKEVYWSKVTKHDRWRTLGNTILWQE